MNTATTSPLAVHGGPKVRPTPWPVRRLFGQEEKAAVMNLFDRAIADGSHLLGYNGEQERGYCQEFAAWLGGGFADGVNSGTNAVYVALRSLDLEPGSEVIVPAITDPGGIMPVALMDCIPVVADTAPGSYNVGAKQVAACLTERTRAILVAHIAGIPVDLEPILELARARGVPVVEDCAQAHGATYHGQLVGTFGEVSAFSTMFGKHHATGGQGGVVFTRDQARYWRIRQMADRGKPFGLAGPRTNVAASLNCNLDELHATIGRVQLRRLPGFVRHRQRLAGLVAEALAGATRTIRLTTAPAGAESAYWFLLLKIEPARLKVDKTEFTAAVVAEGVPLQPGYWHVPASYEWYQNRAVFGTSGRPWTGPGAPAPQDVPAQLPNIVATEAQHLSILFNESWTEQEVTDLVEALRKVEAAYLR